jgi:hypothetical protein
MPLDGEEMSPTKPDSAGKKALRTPEGDREIAAPLNKPSPGAS